MKKFIPVKITDKEWADKLMDGELYFRPLKDFRPQYSTNPAMKNSFRGDLCEGAIFAYTDLSKCEHVQGYSDDFKNTVSQLITLDEDDMPHYKLFCMYALEYDIKKDCFYKPDSRIKEFGDTAVVFADFDQLLRRFLETLGFNIKHSILIDRINYYSPEENRQLNPLFEKIDSYSWQNELRLAYGELIEVAPDDCRLLWNTASEVINVGSIRDIAVEIPIQSFLDLSFLEFIPLRFPMADDVKPPFRKESSMLDLMVTDTKKAFANYYCNIFRDIATIYKESSR